MSKPDPKLSIKTPCPKLWGELVGDDKKRFCSQCQKHVFNGESMTQIEVTDMVREGNGTTCMRLITDDSGSIVYKDSPKKIKPSSIVKRAGLAIAAGGLVAACSSQPEQTPVPEPKPIGGSEQAGMPAPGPDVELPIEIFEEELGEICEELLGDVIIEEAPLPEEAQPKYNRTLGRVRLIEPPTGDADKKEPCTNPKANSGPTPPPEILGTPGPPPPPLPPKVKD